VTNWSLPTDETAEFFIPRLNGDTSCPLTLSIGMRQGTGIKPYTGALGRPKDAKQGNYRQHCLYVGWITCILALLGGVWGLRSTAGGKKLSTTLYPLHSDIPFFVGAAVLFWLLSLGRYCEPLYRLVFALPIGDSIRCPVKWHHLTELALCILAAYGVESLRGLRGLKGLRGTVILCVVVLIGAFDVARIDRVFCVPVDIRQAQRMNCNAQLSILRRQDFANPQVAEMVKRGYIVSLANYLGDPNTFLVEVLQPRSPYKPRPLPPMTAATWLGVLSLCGTLAVAIGSIVGACASRKARSRV